MNLTLKPSKCRSLSIVSGKYKDISYTLGDHNIDLVREKLEKYLGSLITHTFKSSDHFAFIEKKLKSMLDNISSSLVRNEYKLAVYTRYALPSLRYCLTVHDLTDTQLKQLDSITNNVVKQ